MSDATAIVTALIAVEAQSALAATRIHDGYVAPPDRIYAVTEEEGAFSLAPAADGETWAAAGVTVRLLGTEDGGLGVGITAPEKRLLRVRLHWTVRLPEGVQLLGDAVERGYGDLEWRGVVPERRLFWYFVAWQPAAQSGFGLGVETGAAAFAHWNIDQSGYTLTLDTANGGSGVALGARELHAATVRGVECPAGVGSAFELTQALCRRLCSAPRVPAYPVYGGNNWYYAYGKSSHDKILRDGDLMAALAPAESANRPFMVIDDGWQQRITPDGKNTCCGGPHEHGNANFPDMPGLAAILRDRGTRPGIWIRPIAAPPDIPDNRLLPTHRSREGIGPTLDPSVAENLALIASDVRRLTGEWTYELLKFDFTSYDIFGRWGFGMGEGYTDSGWRFADTTRTTAEIIRDLYRTIREAAGDALVLGCNTVGHLGAGLFDLQRTGDDTSGREWERTRKMGVNTLAFRMPQHGAFYAVDADCVGIMTGDLVPWALNRQWLDLVARSGTPLFVSADPDAMTPAIRAALTEAFALASVARPVAEPLDWRHTTSPRRWRFNGDADEERVYDWYDPTPQS